MTSPADMSPDERKRKAELELKIRKRVACEEKAHRIVERLIENPIESDFLIDCAKFITPEHYQDVTEERAVSQLCGYPTCRKYIKDVPKQQYHISVKTNTVYDITERKNFCGNKCYKASDFYKKQIPVSPVWARETEPVPHVTLLDESKNRGSMGKPVFDNPASFVKKELEEIEQIDEATSNHKPRVAEERKDKEVTVIGDLTETFTNQINLMQEKENTLCEVTTEKDLTEKLSEMFLLDDEERSKSPNTETVNKPTQSKESAFEKEKEETEKDTQTGKSCETAAERLMTLIDKREELLKEKESFAVAPQNVSNTSNRSVVRDVAKTSGITSSSVMGNIRRIQAQQDAEVDSDDEDNGCQKEAQNAPVVVPKCVDQVKKNDSIQEVSVTTVHRPETKKLPEPRTTVTPLHLVRKVLNEWKTERTVNYLKGKQMKSSQVGIDDQALEKSMADRQIMEDFDDEQNEKPKAKLPDIQDLEKETVKFDFQMKEYFKGKMSRPTEIERQTNEVFQVQEHDTPEETNRTLPLVDTYAQVALRRRIVLEKLHRVLPDLLGPMKMVVRDVASDIRELVFTFNLSSTNVVLKPGEWTLMAFFLLKMLSFRVREVRNAMEDEAAVQFLSLLMSSAEISNEDVQSVISSCVS